MTAGFIKLVGCVTAASVTCAPNAEIIAHPQLATVILGLSGVVPLPVVDVAVASSGVVGSTPRNTMATAAMESDAPAVPVIETVVSPVDATIWRNIANRAKL